LANTYYVNVGGTWKTVSEYYVNVNGTWKTGSIIQANISGDWTADPSVSFPTALDTATLDYKYFGSSLRVFVDAKAAVSSNGLDNKIWGSRPLWTRSSDFTYSPPSGGGGSTPPNNIPTYDGSFELDLYRVFDTVLRIVTASKSGVDGTSLELTVFDCKPLYTTKSTFVYSAPSGSPAASPSILPYKKNLEGLEYKTFASRPTVHVSAKPEAKGGSLDYAVFGCKALFALPTGAVRTNLALHLDASDPDSYGGSGTIWGNLSNKDTSRSVDFNGSNQALNIPDDDAWYIETNYTAECWFHCDAIGGGWNAIFGQWPNQNVNATNSWILEYVGTDLRLYYLNDGATSLGYKSLGTISLGQWHHFALSKAGSTTKLFIDGVQVVTDFDIGTLQDGNGEFTIGGDVASSGWFNGQISNVRITKGQALYTSSFDVPTEPLTTTSQGAIAENVKLLCCNDPSVTGSTVSTGTIAAVNSPIASGANPFEPYGTIDGATYSSTVGGLFNFDGSNDTVSISDHVSLEPKNIDWTFEAWINVDSSASSYNCILSKNAPIQVYWVDNQIKVWASAADDTSNYFVTGLSSGSNSLAVNGWHHVVVSRASNVWKIYIDKVEKVSGTHSGTVFDTTANAYIGSYADNSYYFKGMIAQARIYNNKGLSSSEVTQNYEETKHIFGV